MKNHTYIALLRGINVGGNSKVSMAELKKVFENMGFADVRTYINSGNVILTSSEKDMKTMDKKIEEGIEKHFGFHVPVVIRDLSQIREVCEKIPEEWTNDGDQKTDVMFLWDEVDSPEVLKMIKTNPDVDNLIYVKGAVIWHLDRKDYGKSRMNKFIGTRVYKLMTARNVNTVRKLNTLMKN